MGKEILKDRLDTAARIRDIRDKAGLTQEKFAERLGISLSGYKKIENAENQISVNGLRKLKQKFHVSADYVLFGADESMDGMWDQIQGCSDSEKMFLLVKLLYYFMRTRDSALCLQDGENDVDKALIHVMDEIKNI